jgi:hypothetical protein
MAGIHQLLVGDNVKRKSNKNQIFLFAISRIKKKIYSNKINYSN